MKTMVNIALPKGRLGEKVYQMFEAAGFECPTIHETNRKLIFENEATGVRYFWVKPSDVAIYVERGAADIGIAGGKETGLLFKKGKMIKAVPQAQIVDVLKEEILKMIETGE